MNKKVIIPVIFFLCVFCVKGMASDSVQKNKQGSESMKSKETDNDTPFGVLEFLHWDHSWNRYKYPDEATLKKAISLMKEAGVGWVRMDFLWQDIEPKKGSFDFGKYDTIVHLLNTNTIRVLGILHYSADWASSCGKWNCPPKDNVLFVNYASEVIKRYRGKVDFWEIWNEPDSSTYWKPQDGLKSYCALLKDVYNAAKKVSPECKILNGGLAGGISSVNKLYDNGAKDYFDILNIHIFETPLSSGAIKKVLAYPQLAYKIMKRNGDAGKKIWITEIGCPGIPALAAGAAKEKNIGGSGWGSSNYADEPEWVKEALATIFKVEQGKFKKPISAKNWWMGPNPDEEKQAEWVNAVFTHLVAHGPVDKVFWAFFRDCNKHWDNGTDYFGLVCWDFSPKRSFFTYKKCFENWKRNSVMENSLKERD